MGGKKRLTTEEFIQKARKVHGDRYDYSRSVYLNTKTKLEIICPEHGSFWQMPINHLRNHGCQACGGAQIMNTEKFIHRARALHGDKYDYGKSEYKDAHSPVVVTCSVHGDFLTTPSNHLSGKGCQKCGWDKLREDRRHTLETLISKAKSVHGDKYDYSLIDESMYINVQSKLPFICKEHGVFYARAQDHLSGRGCMKCRQSGYRSNKPGWLYVLTVDDITKVGITNRSVESRIREISRSFGKKFTKAFTFYHENGDVAQSLETILLADLRSRYKQPEYKYDGSTESFYDVDLPALIQQISDEVELLQQVTQEELTV